MSFGCVVGEMNSMLLPPVFQTSHRSLLSVLAALPLFVCAGPTAAQGADGAEVMDRVERALASDGEQMSVRMTLTGASGKSEERVFQMWMTAAAGGGARSLLRFQSPASISGTALLSVRRAGGGQDNWLYVPGLGQVRRVAAADRKQSFVQSEFTIEDITVAQDPKNRIYTVLGEVVWSDRPCLQLEDRPRDEAAAKMSGYGRVVLYVDKEHFVVHRVDFYDHAGALLKVLRAQKMVKVGEKWRFDVATMTNLQTGASTVMQVMSRVAGAVDESLFSPSGLDAW